MSRRVRYRCSIRQFLNRPGHHGTAAIIACVENTSRLAKEELRYGRQPNVYLSISDCFKEVKLQFDLQTSSQQVNALYKIKTLVEALTEFRTALEEEIHLLRKRAAGSDEPLEQLQELG
jgi:hypothetical protein